MMPNSDPKGLIFLTYETEFVLFVAVLKILSCSCKIKSDVKTLNFRGDIIFAPSQKTLNDVGKS